MRLCEPLTFRQLIHIDVDWSGVHSKYVDYPTGDPDSVELQSDLKHDMTWHSNIDKHTCNASLSK